MLGRYTTGPVRRGRTIAGDRSIVWRCGRPAQPPHLYSPPMSHQPHDRPIDLRSDTVTHPTAAMLRAMAEAELGDDVFGDDPTVIALEERAAELLGKEAGLFVASGAMGNLVAQMAHLARGHETTAGEQSHIVMDEAASPPEVGVRRLRVSLDRAA